MDMNKEKEAFEAWWDESGDLKNNGPWEKDTPIQFAWEAWQAAKASAVPDGHCVVPKEISEKQIDAFINTPDPCQLEVVYKTMIEAAQEPAND